MSVIYKELGEMKSDYSMIPENCLTFVEESFYVAEYAEGEFNKLFESVGIDELAVFESTGCQVVYEGAKLDEFKNKVSAFFKKMWAAIKGAFEKFIKLIGDKTKEFINACKEIKDIKKIDADKVKTISDEVKFGKMHEFPEAEFDKKYGSGGKSYANKVKDKLKEADAENYEEIKKKLEEDLIKEVSGIEKENVKDMTEELRKKLIGEEKEADVSYIANNIEYIKKSVFDANEYRKEISKNYKETKSTVDEILSEIKKTKDEDMNIIKGQVALYKSIVTTQHSCNTVIMDVLKKRFNESAVMLLRVAKAVAKVSPQKLGESTSYTESVDMVTSAFEW